MPFRAPGFETARWIPGLCLTLLPSVLAVSQLGRIHPDEVYQYLEPAFVRVHGYGVIAWEWREGLRNWVYPLVLASLLRICGALGISHPIACRAVLALPQAILHGWALWAAYQFTRRRSEEGAALAVAVLGLQGLLLVYAGRTLGESLSASFLWIACDALDRRRTGSLGGIALGFAVLVRYASAAAALGALVALAVRRDFRRLAWTVAGGTAVALLLGGVDWLTWGQPFHSLVAYLRFNVLSSGAANRFGTAPPSFYLLPMVMMVPLWTWPALVASRRDRSVDLPLWAAGFYLAAALLAPHKEERFLYPVVQLLALAATPAVARFLAARARASRILLASSAVALIAVSGLTAMAAPDLRGDQFRAIVRASQAPGARGLLIVNEGLWGAGGAFYVGKRIPWSTCDWPHDFAFRRAMADRTVNRAVTFEARALPELQAAGFRVVDRVGRETILWREP